MLFHLRLLLLLALVAFPLCGGAASLDPLIGRKGLWQLSQDAFAKLPEAEPFEWTSKVRDSARAAAPDLRLFGLPLVESVVRFGEGHLAQITVNIYARGDAGDLSKDQFEMLLKEVIAQVGKAAKVKYVERGKEESNAVKAVGLVWQTPTIRYLLEYSFSREKKWRGEPFQAEFIRLTIAPAEAGGGLAGFSSSSLQQKFNGRSHVKSDAASGDVLIPDVPMVDQGQKGYCAVACAERLMRYYGIAMDANELAQAANSDGQGGTDVNEMLGALRRLSSGLRVRVLTLELMDVRQLQLLMVQYNRVAKQSGQALLNEKARVIDVAAMYKAMEPEILREVRMKNKDELSKFQQQLQSHIDAGIPLLWSVSLGIFPEKGISPLAIGGHMRLLIGYNTRTGEVIYSDSWGPGHEQKRMSLGDAWTITTALTSIEPL